MDKQDAFDRIMAWRLLKSLLPFYKRYKGPLLYLFFGGITFFLSMTLFWLLSQPLGMNPLWANVVDWILCLCFAYYTNRTWVFTEKSHLAKGIIREFSTFAVGRLGTLVLEEAVLWLGIDMMHINSMVVKVVAQVLVIIGNYVISKFFVFKKPAANDK